MMQFFNFFSSSPSTQPCRTYATQGADKPLEPFTIQRRAVREHDVRIQILFCGMCHSDLHIARNDAKSTMYPFVPGHEIIGRVIELGPEVTTFKLGDVVGVGCRVDACLSCDQCKKDMEPFCRNQSVKTYNDKDKHGDGVTYGGYAETIVVRDAFVLMIPKGMDLAKTAPLLCAGITTYSPLKHWKVGPGSRVGVVGLGGLGHVGVRIAKGLGATVTVFTTSASKAEAAKDLGADRVVVSRDADAMKAATGSLDFILDTVSAAHDLDALLNALDVDGVLCLLGLVFEPAMIRTFPLTLGRKSLVGSLIGGQKETAEMLQFCAEKNIYCDIELIDIKQVNEAFDRMDRGDVRYRFVIDMEKSQF